MDQSIIVLGKKNCYTLLTLFIWIFSIVLLQEQNTPENKAFNNNKIGFLLFFGYTSN